MNFPLGKSKSFFAREILSCSNDGRRLLSSEEKVFRKTRAKTCSPQRKLQLCTNYETMFSDTRPRNQLKVKTDNQPQTPASSQNIKLKSVEDVKQLMEVQGSHRSLFYRQPSRKHLSSYSTVVVDLEGDGLKTFEPGSLAVVETLIGEKPSVVITLPIKSGKTATKETQTDYRESEAQTLPWTHDIRAEKNIFGELMTLRGLGLERNFPPGLEELTQIEMARQKLAWENVIAKLKGKENESTRKFLVVRMAASAAFLREKRIEEINRERMNLSESELKKEKERSERNLRRMLEKLFGRRRAENNLNIDYWHHQLTRQLRKMKSHGNEAPAKTKKMDVIALYKDKTSELYAPSLRNGENPSRRHEMIDIRCRYLKRFYELSKLEEHLESSVQPTLVKLKDFSSAKEFGLCPRLHREKAHEVPEEEKFLESLNLKVSGPQYFDVTELSVHLTDSEGKSRLDSRTPRRTVNANSFPSFPKIPSK